MRLTIEDRVVLVKAEFDGRQAPKFATGFRIDGEVVLTVEHVLMRADGRRADRVWVLPNRTAERSDSDDEFMAEPIWWGSDAEESVDVALLKSRGDRDLRRFDAFVHDPSRLGATADWQTFAFATAFRKFTSDRGRTCFKGELRIADRADREIAVRIDDEGGERSQGGRSGWRGVSGAPVIVGETICAILQTTGDTDERLTAIPTWRILSLETFREAAGLAHSRVGADSKHRALTEETARLMASDKKLVDGICRWRASLADHRDSLIDFVGAVVDAAATSEDLEDLGFVLLGLKKDRLGEPGKLRDLRTVAMNLYCLILHRGATHRPDRPIRLDGKLWICPTAAGSVGELMLSGQLGRKARLVAGDLGPRPEFEIPQTTMEAGIASEAWAEEQGEEIKTRLVLNDLSALVPRAAARFSRDRTPRKSVTAQDHRLASKLTPSLRAAMRIQSARDDQPPWHLALRQGQSDSVSPFLKSFVEKLAVSFPHLEYRVLEWTADQDELEASKIEEEAPLLALWELCDLQPMTFGEEPKTA